jgi:hypothetical protein
MRRFVEKTLNQSITTAPQNAGSSRKPRINLSQLPRKSQVRRESFFDFIGEKK